MFGAIKGSGAYSIMGRRSSTLGAPVPMMHAVGDDQGSIRVKHREYLGLVDSSLDFTSRKFRMNPGNDNTFPWLSDIARKFQEYRFMGCMFNFVSTSATALATGNNLSMGQVVFTSEYNVYATAPSSLIDALNTQFSTSNRPSASFMHPVECNPHKTSTPILYVDGRIIPQPGQDQRLYDLCATYLCVEGVPSLSTGGAQPIGQLWITYDVLLSKPVQNAQFDILDDASSFVWYTHPNMAIAFPAIDTATNQPFGTIAPIRRSPPEYSRGATFEWANTGAAQGVSIKAILPPGFGKRFTVYLSWYGQTSNFQDPGGRIGIVGDVVSSRVNARELSPYKITNLPAPIPRNFDGFQAINGDAVGSAAIQYVTQTFVFEILDPSLVSSVTFDGRLYGLPFMGPSANPNLPRGCDFIITQVNNHWGDVDPAILAIEAAACPCVPEEKDPCPAPPLPAEDCTDEEMSCTSSDSDEADYYMFEQFQRFLARQASHEGAVPVGLPSPGRGSSEGGVPCATRPKSEGSPSELPNLS
jgi:hypothetical protein